MFLFYITNINENPFNNKKNLNKIYKYNYVWILEECLLGDAFIVE